MRQSAGAFAQDTNLKSDTESLSHLSNSVALDGDTLAVGVWQEDATRRSETDNSAGNSGSTYVFG